MKVNFDIDAKTSVEFDKTIEPEIIIQTKEGLIEIFGTEEDLRKFAKDLYEKVNQ